MRAHHAKKELGYLISRLRIELALALDRTLAADSQFGSLGLTAAQYAIMATMAAEGSKISATALCRRISYDCGAMTRMLDRLEAKQLIRRQRCTEDRRRIYVELTEEARAALPRMREMSHGVVNHLLHGFTSAEARKLEGYLSRMLQNAHSGSSEVTPYVSKKTVGSRSAA
jgi:DNA-binding MarR family transcriptional regulator